MSSQRAMQDARPASTYRGHRIVILREREGWRGVMDDTVQTAVSFETPEEASAWLRRRIDDKIAEAIFPGLGAAWDNQRPSE